MEYFVKVDILEKISKLIRLYAKQNRLYKYLIIKRLNDKYISDYEIILLQENKVFEHSKFFKSNKKKFINRRGDKNKEYYENLKRFFNYYHPEYLKCKNLALKLINKPDDFIEEDFLELNSIYRTLKKIEKNKCKTK